MVNSQNRLVFVLYNELILRYCVSVDVKTNVSIFTHTEEMKEPGGRKEPGARKLSNSQKASTV